MATCRQFCVNTEASWQPSLICSFLSNSEILPWKQPLDTSKLGRFLTGQIHRPTKFCNNDYCFSQNQSPEYFHYHSCSYVTLPTYVAQLAINPVSKQLKDVLSESTERANERSCAFIPNYLRRSSLGDHSAYAPMRKAVRRPTINSSLSHTARSLHYFYQLTYPLQGVRTFERKQEGGGEISLNNRRKLGNKTMLC